MQFLSNFRVLPRLNHLISTHTYPPTITMAATTGVIYTLGTTVITLHIQFSQVDRLTGSFLASQKHTITIPRDRSAPVIKITPARVIVPSEKVALSPDAVICVDGLPRVEGSAFAMYAIGRDQVAVLMHAPGVSKPCTMDTDFSGDRPRFDAIEDGIKFRCLPVEGDAQMGYVSRVDEREAKDFLETVKELLGAKETVEWQVKKLENAV